MRIVSRYGVAAGLTLLVIGSASAWAEQRVRVGDVRSFAAQSPHPYPLGDETRPVVWTESVISPGATFVRVHFRELSLAPGDFVTVESPDGSQVWTYKGRGPHGNGAVWAFAVRGDEAIVKIHGGRAEGFGYVIDAVGHGTGRPDPTPEVVCGTDGREDVACHTGDAAFNTAQRPVARLLFTSGGLQYVCTGWLVAGSNSNTMLTNNHCFSTQTATSSVQATFNFQRATCGGGTNATTTTYNGGTFLKTNAERKRGNKGGLDYTIFTLLGNPEATWGELTATTQAAAVNDTIWFIQHPGGFEKEVGWYEESSHTGLCDVDTINQTYGFSATGSQTGYACDSEGGSSGSPIVKASTGRVIALHHYGGVASCLNSGTQLSKICADAGSLLSCVNN